MSKKPTKPAKGRSLRQRAEERLRTTRREIAAMPVKDVQQLVHELQVHQLELKMQNEELRQAQAHLEAVRDRYVDLYEFSPVGLLTLDTQGHILEANAMAATLLSLTRNELSGKPLMRLIAGEDRDVFHHHVQQVFKGGTQHLCEVRLPKKPGIARWVLLKSRGILDGSGRLTCWQTAVVDINPSKQAEEKLKGNEEMLRAIMNSLSNHIVVLDQQGAIIAVNDAWSQFGADNNLQRSYVEWLGMNYFDVCRKAASHDEIARQVLQGLEDVRAGLRPSFTFEYPCHSVTEQRWFHLRVTSLHGTTGGLVVSHENITDRKLAQDFLRTLNERLEQRVKERTVALAEANERWEWVVRATHDGVWDWDLVSDWAYFSPRWKEIHGFQDGDLSESSQEWSSRLHPEDQQRVENKLQAYLAGIVDDFWEEYRIQRKDGIYIWVLDRGVAVFDEEGRAIRMVGAETDITWRKESEEVLRRSEQEFRTLADNVPALFSYIDRDRRYRFVNKRYKELFGRLDEEMVGLTVSDLLGADGYLVVKPYLDTGFGGEAVSFECELAVPGDGVRYLSVQYVPDRDAQGQVVGLFALLADVTALKLSERVLQDRESELRYLSAKLLQVQEEERRRIARDLHDDVTQRLAALTLELHGMRRYALEAGCDPSVISQVQRLGECGEQLTTDVQQLAHHLHPSILEHAGLEVAAREQVDEFAARTGLATKVTARDVPHPIPLDSATCLYRVLQESLRNVRKHANASNVLVRLLGTNRGVGLCVRDDGQGFGPTSVGGRKGLGLTSMAERVWSLKGTFRVRTRPGDGTEIHAWIPLKDATSETEEVKRET